MSIDANYNRFIRELLISNTPTCSIWHSGAVGGKCEKLRQCIAKTIVTVRRVDPEAKGVFSKL